MKDKIVKWLDEDDRDYEIKDHDDLKWMIQLKHGDRVILLGNPTQHDKRLEVVYKLNVSSDHKKTIKKLDNSQRSNFEKSLVMNLAHDNVIYNIQRDEDNLPSSIVIKKHLYQGDLNRTLFFDTIQSVVNDGMRATIHFQSLGGPQVEKKEVSSTKPGPSLYR